MLIPNMSFILAENLNMPTKIDQISAEKCHFYLSEQKSIEPEHDVILFHQQIAHVLVACKKLYRMVSNLEWDDSN
jgi:hypothetical protein